MQTTTTAKPTQIYTQEEAFEASLIYFKGDDLAARVWVNKYALKDSYGNIYERTPDDMHRRIASEIARIESKYPNPLSENEVYDLIKNFKYIVPQGGPMSGIGNPFQIASLSNCFVIGTSGNSDSYGGIMKVDQEQVQLMKRRGGVGHDLSHIRPK
ncbi:MAG TPA: ribonucleotide reductase N-terminal alpha domain-containing protein, partial [Eudoraea sp.]|nr:ribonucleotide reductase N-terminal alpha domain-containing protein [Eudoraea sp.]